MIVLKAKCTSQRETPKTGRTHLTIQDSNLDKSMDIYSEKEKGAFNNMEMDKEYKITIEEVKEDLVNKQIIQPMINGGRPIPTGLTIENINNLLQISTMLDKNVEEDKEYFKKVILPKVSKDIMDDDLVLNIKESWGL